MVVLVARAAGLRRHRDEPGLTGRGRDYWRSVQERSPVESQDLKTDDALQAIVAMVADAFQDVTKRGDLVLDAFLGSGASLIAAERTGRRFRGLDIDPLYVDLAVERWRAHTGGKPELPRLAKVA